MYSLLSLLIYLPIPPHLRMKIHLTLLEARFILRKFFLQNWYPYRDLEDLLEMYYPYSVLHNEVTGYFSTIDHYRISFWGGSWLWNSYSYNGINIDDPFFTGTPLHKINTLNHDILIDANQQKILFNSFVLFPIDHNKIKDRIIKGKVRIGYNYGGIGDRVPFSDEIINTLANHSSAQQRIQPPPKERRKINYNIDYSFYRPVILSTNTLTLLNVSFNNGSRKFLDYDYLGFSNTFSENYTKFSLSLDNIDLFSKNKKPFSGLLIDYTFS